MSTDKSNNWVIALIFAVATIYMVSPFGPVIPYMIAYPNTGAILIIGIVVIFALWTLNGTEWIKDYRYKKSTVGFQRDMDSLGEVFGVDFFHIKEDFIYMKLRGGKNRIFGAICVTSDPKDITELTSSERQQMYETTNSFLKSLDFIHIDVQAVRTSDKGLKKLRRRLFEIRQKIFDLRQANIDIPQNMKLTEQRIEKAIDRLEQQQDSFLEAARYFVVPVTFPDGYPLREAVRVLEKNLERLQGALQASYNLRYERASGKELLDVWRTQVTTGLRPFISERSINFAPLHPVRYVPLPPSVSYDSRIALKINGKKTVTTIGKFVDEIYKYGKMNDDNTVSLRNDVEVISFEKGTFDIDYNKVKSVYRHECASLERIVLADGRSVDVTDSHSLFVVHNGRLIEKRAGELDIDDYVIVPKNRYEDFPIPEIDGDGIGINNLCYIDVNGNPVSQQICTYMPYLPEVDYTRIPTSDIMSVLSHLGHNNCINSHTMGKKEFIQSIMYNKGIQQMLNILTLLSVESLTIEQILENAVNDINIIFIENLLDNELIARDGIKYRLTNKGAKVCKEIMTLFRLFMSDFAFVPVISRETIPNAHKYVYDLSVERAENFLCGNGGIFCHNTYDGVYIGQTRDNDTPVFFDPEPRGTLNPNIMVLGDSGSGKTTFLRLVCSWLAMLGYKLLVFDGQGDFVSITDTYGGRVISMGQEYYLNPTDVEGDEELMEKKARLLEMLKETLELGTIQEAFMNDAINSAYRSAGFMSENPMTWNNARAPTLFNIYRALQGLLGMSNRQPGEKMSIQSCINRLRAYAIGGERLGIYQGHGKKLSIYDLVEGFNTLDFSNIPTDAAKKMITYTILQRVDTMMKARGADRKLDLFLVLDEVWELAQDEKSIIVRLVRQVRKYGIGMMFSAQEVKSVHGSLVSQSSTRVAFKTSSPDHTSYVAKYVKVPKERESELTTLPRGKCFFITGDKLSVPLVVNVQREYFFPCILFDTSRLPAVTIEEERLRIKEILNRDDVIDEFSLKSELGVSTTKGLTRFKEVIISMERAGEVEFEEVVMPQGKTLFYGIPMHVLKTKKSVSHRAVEYELVRILSDEYRIRIDKTPDIIAGDVFAIEIETGKKHASDEDIRNMLMKHRGRYELIILVVPKNEVRSYKAKIADMGFVTVLPTKEIDKIPEMFRKTEIKGDRR